MYVYFLQFNIFLFQNIAPGALATAEFRLTPPWAGRHQISAKFNSKELKDVDGFLSFKVEVPPETNGLTDIDTVDTSIQ